MKDDWRSLRIGDRIRIVRLPRSFGFLAPDTVLAPEVVRLYRKLIARCRPVVVSEVDRDGRPWVTCRFRRRKNRPGTGALDIHFLAVDDDSWVRVRPRRK